MDDLFREIVDYQRRALASDVCISLGCKQRFGSCSCHDSEYHVLTSRVRIHPVIMTIYIVTDILEPKPPIPYHLTLNFKLTHKPLAPEP